MMRNMVKEYGKRKAKDVYYGMENKMKKEAPKKAEKIFNVKPVQKGKSSPLKNIVGKIAKAAPRPLMNKLKAAMPAKLKDIKAKLKK